MTVFKNYLKLFKTQIKIIIIYLVIFGGFAVMLTQNKSSEYQALDQRIGVVDKANTEESKLFIKYLKNFGKITTDHKDNKKLDLNVYYRALDFAIVIPEDFNLNSKLKTISIEQSFSTLYLSEVINNYFNLTKQYKASGVEESKILDLVIETSKEKSNVHMLQKNSSLIDDARYFFNYINYIIISLSLSIVGMIMFSFKKIELNKRNMASPYGIKRINGELFIGNIVAGTIIWLVNIGLCYALFSEVFFHEKVLLMLLNSYIFTIMIISFSLLISSLIKKKNALPGITNVVALGSSFLCGAFIPQEILGESVLSFSRVLPSYWYISANNNIANNKPILLNIIILLGFTLLFYVINLIVTKKRN
jgi:ABC-2 type transport system permease protein